MAEKDLQPLLDTHQNQLTVLLGAGDSIDNRALGLVASVVAILIFIGQANLNIAWWLWLAVLAPYATSLVYAVLCLRPRVSVGTTVDLAEHPEYLALNRQALLAQLLANTRYYIKINSEHNAKKGLLLIHAFFWALGGVVVLLVILGVN